MRKCIRCESEMKDDYDVKTANATIELEITKPGISKASLGHVHVAACPKCGYLEFYLDDTSKL